MEATGHGDELDEETKRERDAILSHPLFLRDIPSQDVAPDQQLYLAFAPLAAGYIAVSDRPNGSQSQDQMSAENSASNAGTGTKLVKLSKYLADAQYERIKKSKAFQIKLQKMRENIRKRRFVRGNRATMSKGGLRSLQQDSDFDSDDITNESSSDSSASESETEANVVDDVDDSDEADATDDSDQGEGTNDDDDDNGDGDGNSSRRSSEQSPTAVIKQLLQAKRMAEKQTRRQTSSKTRVASEEQIRGIAAQANLELFETQLHVKLMQMKKSSGKHNEEESDA